MKIKILHKLNSLEKFINDKTIKVNFITQGTYTYTVFYTIKPIKKKLK